MKSEPINIDALIKIECDANGISTELFYNALNGIDPKKLSNSEIEHHAKWCSENYDSLNYDRSEYDNQ